MESHISRHSINRTCVPIPNMAIAVGPVAVDRGRAHAFSYPETTGRWKPRLSCYGLPYVTNEQVTQSAVRIGSSRFERWGA